MTEVFMQALPIFLLIFCRVTAFFVVAPIFSHRSIPAIFKIGLGFFISLIVFMIHGPDQTLVVDLQYVYLIVREVLIGILLGFIVYLFFAAMQIAGGIIDLQIGFAMANVIDPVTGVSVPLLGNFKYMIMMLVFLMMNGHHYLLQALMDSYSWMPVDNNWFSRMADGSIAQFLVSTFVHAIVIGVQVALPIMVALFITDVGLGFLAKTAPQFNVFVIGFPIKILLGIFLLTLYIPTMGAVFEWIFSILFNSLKQLFGIMQEPPSVE